MQNAHAQTHETPTLNFVQASASSLPKLVIAKQVEHEKGMLSIPVLVWSLCIIRQGITQVWWAYEVSFMSFLRFGSGLGGDAVAVVYNGQSDFSRMAGPDRMCLFDMTHIFYHTWRAFTRAVSVGLARVGVGGLVGGCARHAALPRPFSSKVQRVALRAPCPWHRAHGCHE